MFGCRTPQSPFGDHWWLQYCSQTAGIQELPLPQSSWDLLAAGFHGHIAPVALAAPGVQVVTGRQVALSGSDSARSQDPEWDSASDSCRLAFFSLAHLLWTCSPQLKLSPTLPLPTTVSAPYHPLSLLIFTFSSYSSPTCHHTTFPSDTLNNPWLAYCTKCTQPQPPAIPHTSTLHYNRNT
jgi:hypothetical protein